MPLHITFWSPPKGQIKVNKCRQIKLNAKGSELFSDPVIDS